MSEPAISVVGVVAAYKRPAMLRNLLQSIAGTKCLRHVLVVDNGLDAETEAICRNSPVPVQYHRPESNLGCGGGVACGLQLGLRDPGVTHFCLMDDDAEATPGAIDSLVDGMLRADADVAMPLVLDRSGHIAWYPGIQQHHAWQVIRQPGLTPSEFRRLCGNEPIPFTWAPWPVIALSARSVRECGYPRDDFWLCAEDLEYTLRLTYRFKGVLVPAAVCVHLPPSAASRSSSPPSGIGNETSPLQSSSDTEIGGPHYLRFCLMLQNLSYICTRLPHARRALRHLPANFRRFLRIFGWHASTLRDAGLALWRGAGKGKPAGQPGADGFKQRFLRLGSQTAAAGGGSSS